MRSSRLFSILTAGAASSWLAVVAAVPGQATPSGAPDAIFATPGKARAATRYWTFDRMNQATPRLPDLLDPVTMEPVRSR